MPKIAECWGERLNPHQLQALPPSRSPSPHGGIGRPGPADQMNDPSKLEPPTTAPGLFLPIQLQSPAHERLLRELNQQIDDIYRKLTRYEDLFLEKDDNQDEEEERRDRMRSEQDRNQEKIRLMRILGDWFAGANFDMESARVPISEEEMRQSYQALSEAMIVVCQGLDKLRDINRSSLTMCGHIVSPETKFAEKGCIGYTTPSDDIQGHAMASESVLTPSTFLITSAGEFEQSQAVAEAWKNSANEVVNHLVSARDDGIEGLEVFEDKVMRLAHTLEEQNATIQNLQKHVVDRAMAENRCQDQVIALTQCFEKLSAEFLKAVGEEIGRPLLNLLADELAKEERKNKGGGLGVSSAHSGFGSKLNVKRSWLMKDGSMRHGGTCAELETQLRDISEDNKNLHDTVEILTSTHSDKESLVIMIEEKDRFAKMFYAAERRFKDIADGLPLDEVIRMENDRLLTDQRSLQHEIRELEIKIADLEQQLLDGAVEERSAVDTGDEEEEEGGPKKKSKKEKGKKKTQKKRSRRRRGKKSKKSKKSKKHKAVA